MRGETHKQAHDETSKDKHTVSLLGRGRSQDYDSATYLCGRQGSTVNLHLPVALSGDASQYRLGVSSRVFNHNAIVLTLLPDYCLLRLFT